MGFSGIFKENSRVKGMYLLQRSYKVSYKSSKYRGFRGKPAEEIVKYWYTGLQ